MFRKKEDPTELELLRIRVRNLEKQVAELKKGSDKSLDLSSNTAIKTQLEFDGITIADKSSVESITSHVITVVGPMEIKITADGVEVKKAPQVQAEELEIGTKIRTIEGEGVITDFIYGNPVCDFKNRKGVTVAKALLTID